MSDGLTGVMRRQMMRDTDLVASSCCRIGAVQVERRLPERANAAAAIAD
jgi:hypothetical protein